MLLHEAEPFGIHHRSQQLMNYVKLVISRQLLFLLFAGCQLLNLLHFLISLNKNLVDIALLANFLLVGVHQPALAGELRICDLNDKGNYDSGLVEHLVQVFPCLVEIQLLDMQIR